MDDIKTPNYYIDLNSVGNGFRVSLCVLDKQGIIIYMNKSFAYDCGVDPIKALGHDETFFTRDHIFEDISLYRRSVFKTIRRMDGYAFISGIPIFDNSNEIEYIGITIENEASFNEVRRSFEQYVDQQEPIVNVCDEDTVLRPLIGRHRSMVSLRQFIKQIGPSDASVLVTGESGTGKEVVADCIQAMSRRAGKAYIKINCAAIPPSLLESELFGYESGSFTGASKQGKQGLFEAANGGTIFLDEIGDISSELQPKLLRVLQHGEIYRIGSTFPRKTDVRVIAATNCDLNAKITSGSFREDLYYRIAVIPINTPPLRDRKSDIETLAFYFLSIYCEKYKKNVYLSEENMRLLSDYDWPGNVRELQNMIEYFVVCSENSTGMNPDDYRKAFRKPIISSKDRTLEAQVSNYEKSLIEKTLSNYHSLRKCADSLGIDVSTLSRKIKKYNIKL